jgi:hypothetical protein
LIEEVGKVPDLIRVATDLQNFSFSASNVTKRPSRSRGTEAGTTGSAGSGGAEWDASHGSGGGGGGGNNEGTGGAGGNYGAGGGGSGHTAGCCSLAAGAGKQGIIVITYGGLTLSGNVKFLGDLVVVGSITKGAATFEIDDPIDPADKILYHSFVESPDAKNIYDGIATLDENGEVTIQLPEYFDALNTAPRYQFFAMYQAMPNLYTTEEHDNQFGLKGGKPGGEVSWQITGIRHDPYILKHPIIPEVMKGPGQLYNKGVCQFAPLCQ